ncbi:hypothetical protein ABH922_004498 [Rhodococcus sp. 27YEA15]|uniref:hypothetical protein n=1 Tax=Rhodococcus sp. 27YEA15 TaxID=3156259 RepID=UPI003C7BFBFA
MIGTQMALFADGLRSWTSRRWSVTAAVAVIVYVVVAIPTDLIDTPYFTREVPPTWWSHPVLIVSAVLTGLLVATYVASPIPRDRERSGRGMAGTVLTFFAVGCPVCNKLVLLALGSAGAMQYFEPIQPLLAILSIGLLLWALTRRVLQENRCRAG